MWLNRISGWFGVMCVCLGEVLVKKFGCCIMYWFSGCELVIIIFRVGCWWWLVWLKCC